MRMVGRWAGRRGATVAMLTVALLLAVGAVAWPAGGQDTGALVEDVPPTDRVDRFDGRLHANPDTGCIELPPEDLGPPEVVPVEAQEPPARGERNPQAPEDALLPPRSEVPVPYMHAEPWPACDEPGAATPTIQRP